MCTAVTYRTKDHYFGRNLDLEYRYREAVTITPRNYPFRFRFRGELPRHHAIIGMAYVTEGYPLYYDAVNEKGLAMAGLNFPGYAAYQPVEEGGCGVAPFELIPWVLGQCATVEEAKALLTGLTLVEEHFSRDLPLTPMHWLAADREEALVVEPLADGLHLRDDPVGVLTNSPPFDVQLLHLTQYLGLSREPLENRLAPGLELEPYSRGMGAMGLPGDLSSTSRFVRAAFTRWSSLSGEGEGESVSQFFHILGSVEQQRGCVHLGKGQYEITLYSSCCNTDRGIYYYKTYDNSRITAVELHREDLEGSELVQYPLLLEGNIHYQNGE